MTRLNTRVSRATAASYAVLYSQARPIVVSLVPGDELEFRELGRRGRWRLPIDEAFRCSVRRHAG